MALLFFCCFFFFGRGGGGGGGGARGERIYDLAEMFLRLPSTKINPAVMIRQNTWPLGSGAYFACISM